MIILSLLCIAAAIILLIILAVIDMRTFLLPNIYVFPFAVLGPLFHFASDFYYLSLLQILIGGAAGFGVLYVIRLLGNKYYGQESLGLGDVKLLGAAGLWLGAEAMLMAMTIGAAAGLFHGIIYAVILKIKNGGPFNIRRLVIPAGPGFVVGILIAGWWLYNGYVMSVFYSL